MPLGTLLQIANHYSNLHVYYVYIGKVRVVLSFFTGAEEEPPIGWGMEPVLNFNEENPYPTASTCALHLTLPICYYDNYEAFEDALDVGFLCRGGFGLQ